MGDNRIGVERREREWRFVEREREREEGNRNEEQVEGVIMGEMGRFHPA